MERIGCQSNSCSLEAPEGQGTNGPCMCINGLNIKQKIQLKKYIAKLKTLKDQEFLERMCRFRNINPSHICPVCEGSGIRTYGNTTTYMSGIGGQAMTIGVCDECWGSGDLSKPGTDLRKLQTTTNKAIILYGAPMIDWQGQSVMEWYFDYSKADAAGDGEQEPIIVETYNTSDIYKEALKLQAEE